jgi:hypothetical protein
VATTLRSAFAPLAGVLLLLSGCHEDPPARQPPPPARAGDPAMTVQVDDLLDDFKNNLFAASLQYKDKVIRVRGKCGPVGPGPDRQTCIILTHSKWSTNNVYCYPDEATAARLGTLRPGDPVSVIGLCREGGAWDVYLDDCRLEPPDGPK